MRECSQCGEAKPDGRLNLVADEDVDNWDVGEGEEAVEAYIVCDSCL